MVGAQDGAGGAEGDESGKAGPRRPRSRQNTVCRDTARCLPGARRRSPPVRNPTMRRYRIAVIPGDGIGKEVIPAGIEVLKAVAERESSIEWSFDQFDWGSDYYRETGL